MYKYTLRSIFEKAKTTWKRNGLSQAECCRLNSLRPKNFWYWKKRNANELGWQPHFSFKDGLRNANKWYL